MTQDKNDVLRLLEPLVQDAVKWEASNIVNRNGIQFDNAVAAVMRDGDILAIIKSYKASNEYKARHVNVKS